MTPNRYSKAFINIENVFKLEEKDGHEFDDTTLNKFMQIKQRYQNFLNGISLIVIERYYNENKDTPQKFVYLEHDNKELSEMKIMDLYQELESFHNEIFSLACEIADMYNLEVKLNSKSSMEYL